MKDNSVLGVRLPAEMEALTGRLLGRHRVKVLYTFARVERQTSEF